MSVPIRFRIGGVERAGWAATNTEDLLISRLEGSSPTASLEQIAATGLDQGHLDAAWYDMAASAVSNFSEVVPHRTDPTHQPDAAVIIEVSAPVSTGTTTRTEEGIDLGEVDPHSIRRTARFRFNHYSVPLDDSAAMDGIDGLDDLPMSVVEQGPLELDDASRVDQHITFCGADPDLTAEAVERWEEAAGDLRRAAVAVTTCMRLAEASWDSSHRYPQFLDAARAERRLLWDLAERAERTAADLAVIRDDQYEARLAEEEWEEQTRQQVATFALTTALSLGFGMAVNAGRAALVTAAGTGALGRLGPTVVGVAARARAMPVYLRAPVTFAAWGSFGAVDYGISATLVVQRRLAVPAADDLALAFGLGGLGGTALSTISRLRGRPPATPDAPGSWQPVSENMSDRARAYQAQVTGGAPGSAYVVGTVRFDGYEAGVLIDAKGPGYATFVRNGEFVDWFTRGRDALIAQAGRQITAAGGRPVRWYVAESEFADALTDLFDDLGIAVQVVHRPA